ncbi:hypothetical protein CR513_07376, partial [Mucuna pruriens]
MKKTLKKKDLMKTSSPLSQGRSTPCRKTKKDPNGRETLEGTPKKLKTKKLGHFKSECPSLEKESEEDKKKPFFKNRKVDIASKEEDDDEEVIFNDLNNLQKSHQELISNSSTLSISYKDLKKKFSKLSKEFKENDLLKKENDLLKKENESNQKDKIAGIGKIVKHPFPFIDNVLFVEGLKHNLLSISQLSDNGYNVSFNKGKCIVKIYGLQNNVCKINLTNLTNQSVTCSVFLSNDQWTWYKKLGHASLRLISKLKKHNIVRGLPSLAFKVDLLCDACQKGKQVKGSFESKNIVSNPRPLELLHIDLFGLTRIASMSGKLYGLVVVDDYSRWTWVMFLTYKDKSFKVFSISDYGGEFENENFQKFFEEYCWNISLCSQNDL